MGGLATMLMGVWMSTAEAVDWPDLSTPAVQSTQKSRDRAIIIALEEYESLEGVRNATMNATDWQAYFTTGLGLPESQVSVLTNATASQMRIRKEFKRQGRRLHQDGRLWVIYIGHGLTMFDGQQGAILPYYTSTEPKEMYAQAITTTDMASWIGKSDAKSIFVFDTAFNGLDRSGRPLSSSFPTQAGIVPSVTPRSTVISAVSPEENAGYLTENSRPALSYVLLGALRGWSDTDDNGWMTLLEATEYADMVLGSQTPTIQGRLRRQKISQAIEEGPALVRERNNITPVDPMSLVPEGMLQDDVSLDALLQELQQQRTYEVQIQKEIDAQVSIIRQDAATNWKKVKSFAATRVDDPARVAVYAFLREYQDKAIQVQGQSFTVDIPEVQLAQQLLSQLAVPTIHGVEFTWVSGGNFEMGNTQLSSLKHAVRLSHSFYVSTTEVTQQMYQAVMGGNPSAQQGDLYPVTNVSWFDAIRFANALSAFEGLEQCYDITDRSSAPEVSLPLGTNCLGYRLPTEAEWEFVARANTLGGFSGGDRLSRLAWVDSNSEGEIHFVAQKSANEFGVYDMSGNVSEWVWDWYGEYQVSDAVDPLGPGEGTYRVQRGGSVDTGVSPARVDSRYPVEPSYTSPFQGFRVVRTVPDL